MKLFDKIFNPIIEYFYPLLNWLSSGHSDDHDPLFWIKMWNREIQDLLLIYLEQIDPGFLVLSVFLCFFLLSFYNPKKNKVLVAQITYFILLSLSISALALSFTTLFIDGDLFDSLNSINYIDFFKNNFWFLNPLMVLWILQYIFLLVGIILFNNITYVIFLFILFIHIFFFYKWYYTEVGDYVFNNIYIKWIKQFNESYCLQRLNNFIPDWLNEAHIVNKNDIMISFIHQYKTEVYNFSSASLEILFNQYLSNEVNNNKKLYFFDYYKLYGIIETFTTINYLTISILALFTVVSSGIAITQFYKYLYPGRILKRLSPEELVESITDSNDRTKYLIEEVWCGIGDVVRLMRIAHSLRVDLTTSHNFYHTMDVRLPMEFIAKMHKLKEEAVVMAQKWRVIAKGLDSNLINTLGPEDVALHNTDPDLVLQVLDILSSQF